MKKIITLLLVLTGMVCTASAQQITRRIIAELQDNASGAGLVSTWNGWKDGPRIHVWYNDGSSDHDITTFSSRPSMTYLGGYNENNMARKVYCYDVTADESVFSNLSFIITGTDTDDEYNRVTIKNVNYSSEKIYYLYIDGIDGKVKYSAVDVTYYFVNTDGNKKLADLDYNDGVLTGNFAADGNIYGTIAPSYALKDNFTGLRDWSLTISPVGDSDVAVSSFANYNGSIGGGKAYYFTFNSNYDLSFDIFKKTYSIIPYFTRTIDGYATFSFDAAVAIPENVTAYYATAAEKGKVTMTSVSDGIPANTGAFLKAEDGTYTFKPATTTSSESTNLLVPGTASGVTISEAGAYHYVYAEQGGVSAFYNVASAIEADMTGKAYLETTMDIQPATGARVAIVFDDDVTGINSVNRETINNNEYYNLGGQRVAQPTKGLYIVNGKKVVIR